MLSSSQDEFFKLLKAVEEKLSPQKLFDYDCVTLYVWLHSTILYVFVVKKNLNV